jgi:hypothetical protein
MRALEEDVDDDTDASSETGVLASGLDCGLDCELVAGLIPESVGVAEAGLDGVKMSAELWAGSAVPINAGPGVSMGSAPASMSTHNRHATAAAYHRRNSCLAC